MKMSLTSRTAFAKLALALPNISLPPPHWRERENMPASDRRSVRRLIFKVPLRFRAIKMPSLTEEAVQSMNISAHGVYFVTDLPVCRGQLIQVRLQMPKELIGNAVSERRFTGRVAHVQPNRFAKGMSGVGVQFLYYEAA
jgi:hypothetical protein